MTGPTLTRESVRDEAVALALAVHDADAAALRAAHLLDPLQRVAAWAQAWADSQAWPAPLPWLDAAEDEVERLPLGELPAWELRLVRRARRLRQAVDALAAPLVPLAGTPERMV